MIDKKAKTNKGSNANKEQVTQRCLISSNLLNVSNTSLVFSESRIEQ